MNKRSAIVTAGGVVASFVAGVVSVSSGLGLGNTATAATTPTTGPSPARVKPIVKHRRIVVHKKAPTPKATQGGPQTIVLPAPATSTAPISMTSGSHASGGEFENETEHEGGDD
jgi:hypothetical protein